jgi:hypothetical protein
LGQAGAARPQYIHYPYVNNININCSACLLSVDWAWISDCASEIKMTSRLVLAIGDLFIPDRAPVPSCLSPHRKASIANQLSLS